MPYNEIGPSFTNTISRDLLDLTRGEKLGEGMSRYVYVHRLDPSLVIKFETDARSFQNIAEWEVWKWVCGTKMERWFAPCVDISPNGSILIQKRCEPIQSAQRPKMLPAYLCDLKRENFGMFEKRVVCCDYGTMLSSLRKVSPRMQKARWYT